jgi:iron complex outermembrane receptor protein
VQETAQPVTVLGGDRWVARQAASLGDSLADEPGLSASSFGPIASRPIIRGQGGLRVQTYQDGSETLDVGALSDDHAVSIEPMLIDRIEVIRGPAALLFGSTAAAGAVNVITSRLPLERLAAPLGAELDLRGNTAANERGVAVRLGGRTEGRLQFVADAHHFTADDLRIPGGRLTNSGGNSSSASAGLTWVSEAGAFALSVSRLDNDYGLPIAHGEDQHNDQDHQDENIRLAMQQRRFDLSATRSFEQWFDTLRLRVAHSDYRHFELEGEAIGTRYMQRGRDVRLTLERENSTVIGLQWRDLNFNAEGEEAFLPPSRTNSLGLFAFREWPYGSLTFETGARIEHQSLQPVDRAGDGEAQRYTDTVASGSAGAIWRVTKDWNLSLQVTSTSRHPTATELYALGPHLAVRRYEIGDAKLGIERGRTVDLALRHQADNSGWQSSISVFHTDYDNFIAPFPETTEIESLPIVKFAATDARFTGAELELGNDALTRFARGTVGVRVFGDIVRARDVQGNPLPQIPPHRLGIEASLMRNAVRFGIETVWHDAQRDIALGERPTKGFTALSADLSCRLDARGATMLWFLRGENLLDEEIRRHTSPLKDIAPLAARHIVAGLKVKF